MGFEADSQGFVDKRLHSWRSSSPHLGDISRTALLRLSGHSRSRHSIYRSARRAQPRPNWSISFYKRLLDISLALVVLAVAAIPMLAIAVLIRLTSDGPAIFVQSRLGMKGRPFRIFKFRSMVASTSNKKGPTLTKDGDVRITAVGYWLRKFKLDELPQFYNILRGDMSLVGPRPKLPQYAETLTLQYRPGITGAATLAFRCEEDILKQVHSGSLDHFYLRRIRPLKERIDARYMQRATVWSDLGLIIRTFRVAFIPARIPNAFRNLDRSKATEGMPAARTGNSSNCAVYGQGDRELAIGD